MTKVYIQTHGCSTNFSKSEVMTGLLAEAGFNIVDDKESSDIIIINVCTVKGENTALRENQEKNKMVQHIPSIRRSRGFL